VRFSAENSFPQCGPTKSLHTNPERSSGYRLYGDNDACTLGNIRLVHADQVNALRNKRIILLRIRSCDTRVELRQCRTQCPNGVTARPLKILTRIVVGVLAFTKGTAQGDDMTLVVVGVKHEAGI
jgi:hypothetical protein